ncbi:heme/hemin ABC transporter substrate-binding protein [Aliarcobacter cryaerophilus]|uniref:heme/hemin ABC transporter substrate-binding protein n=1 Tax=Aliarcobacter cryaerophilus TaxID=28198 RepID=UPI0021B6D55F|nr:ABC transporter substrate-binding protein [Aliarcobacter cryaerophilus]MCT7542189.1 ABC transporter substrate-binding protein [Aliarcobacter cryaerophilus]
MFNLLRFAVVLIFSISFAYASKIVSVGGSITETIVALGHQDDLIGVDLSSAYPKEVTQLPNIGYWLDLPQEGILSLKPEVVITSEQAGPKKLIDSLPSYGIKTHIISDEATLESAKNKINQIAKILNEEKKAQEIIERMQNNISKMQNEIKDKTKPKVLFLFSRGEGTTMAAGTATKAGVMIGLAGGENIITTKQFSQISGEAILQMNPDVVITSNHTGDIGIDKNVILATNAGKNGQIYDIDMILISGFTVRTDVALQQLSCMFFKNELSYCSK